MLVKNNITIYGTKYNIADSVNIAPIFDVTKSYQIGDYVLNNQNGLLYKFITNHSPGMWSVDEVEEIFIGEAITSAQDKLSQLQNEIDEYENILAQAMRDIETCLDYSQNIELLSNQIGTKAEISEVLQNTFNLYKHEKQINELNKQLLTKASTNELSQNAIQIDNHESKLKKISEQLTTKANADEVASINKVAQLATAIDESLLKIKKIKEDFQSFFGPTINNYNASLIAIDQLQNLTNQHNSSIRNLSLNKLNKPLQNGTAGNVLITDGLDSLSWADPFAQLTENISNIVSTWLEEHHELVVNINDNSIALNHLTPEVRNAIENSQDAQDALILANSIATINDASSSQNPELLEKDFYYRRWSVKFDELANIIANTYNHDTLSFLWFTDPHSLQYNNIRDHNYNLLQQLHELRAIYENTCAKFVLCGGDWLNSGDTRAQAMKIVPRIPNLLRSEIGENTYTIIGNHDINLHGNGGVISCQQLAKLWYDKDIGYFTLNGNDWQGFMFDSGNMSDTMDDYRWGQIDWFANQLLTNNKKHLFGAIHILYNNGEYQTNSNDETIYVPTITDLYTHITEIAQAYNNRSSIQLNNSTYDFSSILQNEGAFHFIIFGHQHKDYNYTLNGIPGFGTTNCPTSALAADICYVDWDDNKLYMVRFGAGSSRTFTITSNAT